MALKVSDVIRDLTLRRQGAKVPFYSAQTALTVEP